MKNKQSLIIFLFAFFIYSNTLNYGYVLDDGLMIRENKFTLEGIKGIPDIFTHDQLGGLSGRDAATIYQGGRYRPLSQVLFALEVHFFKLKPFYGHLIQVIMYSLLCLVVFTTLRKLFINIKAEKWYLSVPFIATVIFASHPIHTEVVANIKSGDEVMCMLGAILSLYFSICYIDRKKISDLLLSFAFFLFGIFSKENAITFLAVVPLAVYFFRKESLRTYFIVVLPLIAATIAYFFIRFSVIGFSSQDTEIKELFHNPFLYASTTERYATIMFTWLKYLLLLIFPHPLTHDYYPKQIAIIDWNHYKAIIAVLIYIFLGVYAIVTIKRKNRIAFGILFFLTTFSVTSNLIFNLGLFMNERLIFMPSLGFAIVMGCLLLKLSEFLDSKSYKYATILIFYGLLLFYSIKTISRNTAWKSDYVLFTTDVQTSVNSGRCNVIAGSLIVAEVRNEKDSLVKYSALEKASEYLTRGLEIYDGNIEGWNSLAEVSIYLSKYDKAEEALKKALDQDSSNTTALNNLFYVGQHYQSQILDRKALGVFNYLISVKPSGVYYYNVAKIYKGAGKIDSAITSLEKAIEVSPDYYDAYNLIAEYYGQGKGDNDKALDYLQRAYELNSNYGPTLENLGIIYGIKADYNQSLYYFDKALALDSSKTSIYTNIARTYQVMGSAEKAQKYFNLATKHTTSK